MLNDFSARTGCTYDRHHALRPVPGDQFVRNLVDRLAISTALAHEISGSAQTQHGDATVERLLGSEKQEFHDRVGAAIGSGPKQGVPTSPRSEAGAGAVDHLADHIVENAVEHTVNNGVHRTVEEPVDHITDHTVGLPVAQTTATIAWSSLWRSKNGTGKR